LRSRPAVRIAALRAVSHRFSFALLLLIAVGLLILGRIDIVPLDGVRTSVSDAVAPILDVLSQPAATVSDVVDEVQTLAEIRAENARLKDQVAALEQYQDVAFRLEAENLMLRTLLNYTPDWSYSFLTARVVSDNAGAFVRSLMINLGSNNGVADGQAVLGGRGLLGRIVQTGERSARILLMTDLNFRVPVVIERTQQHAVVGGDNTDKPRLLYLPPDASLRVGDRVVTSGQGGLFPPGLPLGTVADQTDGTVRIDPIEPLDVISYVKIVEFHDVSDTIAFKDAPGFLK
jgi:rod shape-determining protein MreC